MPDGCPWSVADLRIRRAAVADVPAIAELYSRISAESFAARFLSHRGSRSNFATRFAEFDPAHGDLVLVASPAGRPEVVVAEARYVPTGDGGAEFAILVDDAAHGQGVGGRLMAELFDQAARSGLNRLSATVLVENVPMRRLLKRMRWVLTQSAEYGALELEASTLGGLPGWPDDGRRRVLVESTSYVDDPAVARLRAGGAVVRRCPGPSPQSGVEARRHCPLVSEGTCRLAEGADEIICTFHGEERDAIVAEHRRRWPERLAAVADGPAAGATGPESATLEG